MKKYILLTSLKSNGKVFPKNFSVFENNIPVEIHKDDLGNKKLFRVVEEGAPYVLEKNDGAKEPLLDKKEEEKEDKKEEVKKETASGEKEKSKKLILPKLPSKGKGK